MIYLIGGPPRCGKTQLAARLCGEYGLLSTSTDLLWSVLEIAVPEWREPMAKGMSRIAAAGGLFEPFLERAVTTLATLYPNHVLEGEVIRPANAARMVGEGRARAVFLMRLRVKAADLLAAGSFDSWLSEQPPAVVEKVAEEVRGYSATLAAECAELALPLVDVSGDFNGGLGEAAAALGLPLGAATT